MTSNRLTSFLTVIIFSICVTAGITSSTYAQSEDYVTNSNLRGVVPFGSYQFSQVDNINLATGALDIPTASKVGCVLVSS